MPVFHVYASFTSDVPKGIVVKPGTTLSQFLEKANSKLNTNATIVCTRGRMGIDEDEMLHELEPNTQLILCSSLDEFVPHVIQDHTSPESHNDPITSTPELLQVQEMNDLPMHYCPYCFFKCINERKLHGHIYHFHPMQKYKCHVCYQQFLCYNSLTSHSSRKRKINLSNLPFTNIHDPLLYEDITINATENQIMEAESLVVQPSYEKLFCDLKLKFTCRKFVPETTFNEILSDLCMIKDFNEIMGPSIVTCSVKSKYESLLKNEFSYIIPEKVFLSSSEKHYIYVPIKENLKQYLSLANMIEQLELSAIKNANSITNPPKICDDFVHGKLLQQNMFFAIHPESIGIILYSDGFGSNSNPLRQQTQKKQDILSLFLYYKFAKKV